MSKRGLFCDSCHIDSVAGETKRPFGDDELTSNACQGSKSLFGTHTHMERSFIHDQQTTRWLNALAFFFFGAINTVRESKRKEGSVTRGEGKGASATQHELRLVGRKLGEPQGHAG